MEYELAGRPPHSPGATHVTVLHSGTTKKYVEGWEIIFGSGTKSSAKKGKAKPASRKKSSGKKAAKKKR
jgi:hypothetical protein